jgi:ABC-type transport system involved in cytochrome c biogenesis permease subunit
MKPELWFRGSLSERLKAIQSAAISSAFFALWIVVIGWFAPALKSPNPLLTIGFFFVCIAIFSFAAPGLAANYSSWKRTFDAFRKSR